MRTTWGIVIKSFNMKPLLRLNIEARGKPGLVAEKLAELTALIEG